MLGHRGKKNCERVLCTREGEGERERCREGGERKREVEE